MHTAQDCASWRHLTVAPQPTDDDDDDDDENDDGLWFQGQIVGGIFLSVPVAMETLPYFKP